VGSALAGSRDFVARARFVRKRLGGSMRQAGILAAAALHALDHHVERLAEDHRNAQVIAGAIADTPGLRLTPPVVETNLVWFEVDPDLGTAKDVAAALKEKGILVHTSGQQAMRACTHLDVSAAQAERAADAIRRVVGQVSNLPGRKEAG
jgi:threonine aldolase